MSVSYAGSELKYRLSQTGLLIVGWYLAAMAGQFTSTGIGQLDGSKATFGIVMIIGLAVIAKLINPYPEDYFRLEFEGSELTGPGGHGFSRSRVTVDLAKPFHMRYPLAWLPFPTYTLKQDDRKMWITNLFLSTHELREVVARIEGFRQDAEKEEADKHQ